MKLTGVDRPPQAKPLRSTAVVNCSRRLHSIEEESTLSCWLLRTGVMNSAKSGGCFAVRVPSRGT